jgi:hypothetical protein
MRISKHPSQTSSDRPLFTYLWRLHQAARTRVARAIIGRIRQLRERIAITGRDLFEDVCCWSWGELSSFTLGILVDTRGRVKLGSLFQLSCATGPLDLHQVNFGRNDELQLSKGSLDNF